MNDSLHVFSIIHTHIHRMFENLPTLISKLEQEERRGGGEEESQDSSIHNATFSGSSSEGK